MYIRFRRTFLPTLVAVSLAAAPLAVMAAEPGTGLRSLQIRSASEEPGKSNADGTMLSPVVMYDRSFAPVMESLDQDTRLTGRHGSDWIATPSGFLRLSRLDESPQMFRAAFDTDISQDDVALVHFGDMPMDSVRKALKLAGVTPLGEVPNSAIVVTGLDELAAASLARSGMSVTGWTVGFFMPANVGITPVATAEMAANPILDMQASVFPGADEGLVVSRLEAMGAGVQGSFNGLISFSIDIDDLRAGLDSLTGSWIRAMGERKMIVSVDEDTSSGIEIGRFRGGDRPYNSAGIDGSSQIIGITDTGLSMDSYVFAHSTSDSGFLGTGGTNVIPSHRKIVAYRGVSDSAFICDGGTNNGDACVTDEDCPGFKDDVGTCDRGNLGPCDPNNFDPTVICFDSLAICVPDTPATCNEQTNPASSDLLSCDGVSGATHGHVVASIAAGNASDLADVRLLSGFEPNLSGSVSDHAVDGVAPGARIYFIDDQVVSQCSNSEQIEAQSPGFLSPNVTASQGGGARIHNFSFAVMRSEAAYEIESQDLDTFLAGNNDMLVVTAAGNSGVDADNDRFLDFGTVTSPGTAKNVLTVGSSGYPNNALDPTNSVEPNITNNGIGIISRFTGGGNGSGQGPAAFTMNSAGGNNWRIKPDVMAPGDETLGNQRMTSPTTCISNDNDQIGSGCSRLLPGVFEGTSFAAAAASGAAALVRDYFDKGFAPAGNGGGTSVDISGPELKAALIASADLMVGNPAWRNQGGQLQLAFYTPRHLSTFTPEQGYGRIQLNKVLPLSSEPGSPSYIETELLSLSPATTEERFFKVVNAGEEMRCVVSWYDKESTTAGGGAQGNLVRNVDMVVTECGTACGDPDDVLYLGNHFSEDTDFNNGLLDIAAVFVCQNDPIIICDPADDQATLDWFCGTGPGLAVCQFDQAAITEDCNGNSVLDFGEFSLAATASPACLGDGVDENNNNEAVFLSPSQLGQGDTVKVELVWAGSSEGAPPASIEAGLVCTGGIVPQGGGSDSVRLNKGRYTCADALNVTAMAPAGSTTGAVGSAITVTSIAADGFTVLDSEGGLGFNATDVNVFSSNDVAVVDAASNPPTNNDLVLAVETGGSVVATFGAASASGEVRCTPQLTINNIGRRGINAAFGISGGCDPRGTIDPRAVLGGLIPGTGTSVTGDLFMDANEDVNYSMAFTNLEDGADLLDVRASLKACVAGSIVGATCTAAPGIDILDPEQKLGNIGAGKGQVVSFNVHVGGGVAFTEQVQMVFGITASKNGLTVAAETVVHHVLNVDNWSSTDEDPGVSGVNHYSTDFPTGGREIRVYAGENFDPANPDLKSEVFTFQDMTTAAFGGGNANILGFNSGTGRFENAMANNMPWTFDSNDEAFGARRRFDSDAGNNLELQTRNVWQWSNTGECGFQSNDTGQADFGAGGLDNKGVGGTWHTGHAETMAGTPPGRAGYDIGCEDYDLPGSADPKRERVIDSVASPIFFRVHQDVDSNGFSYQVEFTRFAFNLQYDIGDGNTIAGYELDPDTTTSQPVDPLDFGWLASDQGTEGFLSETSQGAYQVFNPNDPHESTSATADGIPLDETGTGTNNIRSIQGSGSPGSFFEIGNANKAPTRSFGEVIGSSTGRGRSGTIRRGAGGLPVRNYDNRLADAFAGTFEDIFGANETRDPAQTYPISGGNPEILVNRRDSYQVNFTMILREAANTSIPAIPSYGSGIDDVVVEWRESHPIEDRTPCSDPSTWALDDNRNPAGGATTCIGGTNAGLTCISDAECPGSTCTANLASGCAVISWDRTSILTSEDTLTLTVIDSNAQFGPDGVAGTFDEQAMDTDNDGFAEVLVPVNSEVDVTGEVMVLEQIELLSPVYRGTIAVSSTKGLTSASDGTIFIQENGDGTNPTSVNAQYIDQDINVQGAGLPAVPCPDNPLVATALTQFVGTDVSFVTAVISDVGPNADGDLIADPGETIEMGLTLINSTLDVQREKAVLNDVLITLVANSSQVGPDLPIACILDSETFVGSMPSGEPVDTDAADPLVWVVGNKDRVSSDEVLQAQFSLGIVGRYTDSLGVDRQVTSFATPQSFGVNLDLDILPGGGVPLAADTACEGGTQSGLACGTAATTTACTNGGGVCAALPAYLASGGTSGLAGKVGYFEGFEGATGTLGVTNPAGGSIAGTGFDHAPAMRGSGGYLDSGGPLDIDSKILEGFAPGSSAGNAPDNPQGSTAVDGSRCQYNDTQGPSKHDNSEAACRPWDGSDFHVTNHKAFSGTRSLYAGVNGTELGFDESFDTGHTNALFGAFSGTMSVGVAGGATLSIAHIVAGADDRTFSVPIGNSVGRAILEWAIVDPGTGKPLSAWNKINGFQNNYGNTGVVPFFSNCIFEGYDDFYDSAAALGGTAGFDPTRQNVPGNLINADNVGSEDDYFDPNDPLRLFGASHSCFPQFVFSSLGDWTSSDPQDVGKAFTLGVPGETGSGIWIKSLFNLDEAAGRTIRVRYVWTDIDIGPGFTWADLFGNALGNATRGWILDDMAVSGVVDAPIVLAVDSRSAPLVTDCPVDPDPSTPANEAACGFVTAIASEDLAVPVSGSAVVLDAAASSADSCVNGHLEYQWRIGGSIVQDYSTAPSLLDAPLLTTQYTVTVRCSTDTECVGTDDVVVNVLDQREASAVPGELMNCDLSGGTVTCTASEPSVGNCSSMSILGNDLLGAGGELRQASPLDRSGLALGAALRADLCDAGTMGAIGGGQFSLGVSTAGATAAGEIDGYLAVGTCQGIQGTLGRLKPLNPDLEVGRGGVPGGLPVCP